MLTRFQALVSLKSHAEVYPTYGTYKGMEAIVIALHSDTLPDAVKVSTGKDGTVEAWYNLADLEPSDHLISLIERGIYDERSMTWKDFNPETGQVECVTLYDDEFVTEHKRSCRSQLDCLICNPRRPDVRPTVYAVMRGTEFHGVWSTPDLAQQDADRKNALFPRGKRYEVMPIEVKG